MALPKPKLSEEKNSKFTQEAARKSEDCNFLTELGKNIQAAKEEVKQRNARRNSWPDIRNLPTI